MFGFIKRASDAVAISGARDALDGVEAYLVRNKEQSELVALKSSLIVRHTLASRYGIPFDEKVILLHYSDSEFHRAAHDARKNGLARAKKGTNDWAIAAVAMAAFSILGAAPSPERSQEWERIMTLWVTHFPGEEN